MIGVDTKPDLMAYGGGLGMMELFIVRNVTENVDNYAYAPHTGLKAGHLCDCYHKFLHVGSVYSSITRAFCAFQGGLSPSSRSPSRLNIGIGLGCSPIIGVRIR